MSKLCARGKGARTRHLQNWIEMQRGVMNKPPIKRSKGSFSKLESLSLKPDIWAAHFQNVSTAQVLYYAKKA